MVGDECVEVALLALRDERHCCAVAETSIVVCAELGRM